MSMPTSTGSDVLPVRRTTKARLTAAKGSASYDEALRALLDATPEDALRARLDARRLEAANRTRALLEPSRPRRTQAKQILLAAIARERRASWLAGGRIVRLGPRRERYVGDERRVVAEVRRVR